MDDFRHEASVGGVVRLRLFDDIPDYHKCMLEIRRTNASLAWAYYFM